MHAFIFWGALLIGVRELTLMGEGFISGFQEYLPVLGSDSWLGYAYISVYNFCEVLVLAMILIALYRRLMPKPERLELNWEGIYVLLFIGSMMLTDLLFDQHVSILWKVTASTFIFSRAQLTDQSGIGRLSRCCWLLPSTDWAKGQTHLSISSVTGDMWR